MNGNHVNLPESVYTDPEIARRADEVVEALDPIVIDFALPLDLLPEDITEIEADILRPAFETAIADLLEEHPELHDQMPDLPSSLEDSVNAVLQQLAKDQGIADGESEWTHAYTNGSAWLDTME